MQYRIGMNHGRFIRNLYITQGVCYYCNTNNKIDIYFVCSLNTYVDLHIEKEQHENRGFAYFEKYF